MHLSSVVVGRVLAIICCAPVVVCHALVLYMVSCVSVMHWYHASAIVGCALVVCHWLSAIGCLLLVVCRKSLVVHRRPLSIVHCLSLVVGCLYSIVCHLLSVIGHLSSIIGHCWSLAVGCRWSSSLIVVSGCWCKARLYMGRVALGPFQASGHLKRKEKSSDQDAHRSG